MILAPGFLDASGISRVPSEPAWHAVYLVEKKDKQLFKPFSTLKNQKNTRPPRHLEQCLIGRSTLIGGRHGPESKCRIDSFFG